ncbi:MAG: aspartate kinase [Methanoculleaceae archaeon]
MRVMKFGGSSVADATRIAGVIEIIRSASASRRVCVVFSAMKGVTDDLLSAAGEAVRGEEGYKDRLESIRRRHLEVAATLVPGEGHRELVQEITAWCEELAELLHGVRLVRECTLRTQDLIVGFGERLNCRNIAAAMGVAGLPARYVDARELIRTDNTHGSATVEFTESYQLIAAGLSGEDLPVITGFIGATSDGVSTTLGRNGSDYTASLIGAALGAEAIEIWTDVDGVYSADPRLVPDAFVLRDISYHEAMELSYFGAKVIHPYTMVPAVERDIPLWIKNTMDPDVRGTSITSHASTQPELITGIASVEEVALINVEGGGMVGLPGIAGRIFTALARARISIIMISQASSEHSICFVVRDAEAPAATKALEEELHLELSQKRIERLGVERELEIVAVIGENMRGRPGISGTLFNALGEGQINVLAIAQGSSEMNISFIVPQVEREHAIRAVHAAFFPEAVT